MKIEIEVFPNYIKVNGFNIVPIAENYKDGPFVHFDIVWKDSKVARFDEIGDAIKYCQN